jgi:hypothetical protein
MSAAVIIAILVGLGIGGGIGYYVLTLGYGSTLTPAANLAGTWKTSTPVKFYIQTDFESGELQDVGSEDRDVTWVITAGSSENGVNIEQTFTYSNRNLADDSGYTPDVSPSSYTGVISGSRLTVIEEGGGIGAFESSDRIVGEFSFTSTNLQGTWDDNWTMVYSQRVYTTTNGLILNKL